MHYLGICAIIKDEDPFLDEWMAYYLHLGVTAFYLYDNGSRIPLMHSLKKFRPLLGVENLRIHAAPGEKVQMAAYEHCAQTYAAECRWIAFVDMDEFIVPKQHDSIPAMLENFTAHAGLALHWRMFGTNGHAVPPVGLQIENYTRVTGPDDPYNLHIKSIVKPGTVKFFPSPHACGLKNKNDVIVTERGEKVTSGLVNSPSWEVGQINHYYYRSKKDYYAKLRKPRADNNELRSIPGGKVAAPRGGEEDLSALRFADGVKAILARLA
ncbi:conserved hypothetical protein [uncultured delta proteobacterium]|uniref:Glycosyl transferase family 2 n=1 Tax=uncultured delta proteobacterium TaxID=34034 RepID=A0A212JJ59_9DELT|nr:conserved hypothetical protein [uncultured delta proteobacterium]